VHAEAVTERHEMSDETLRRRVVRLGVPVISIIRTIQV
jgi:rRNA-processing protein FCF1